MAPVVKNLPANAGEVRDEGSISGLGRSPWRRAWQPSPVFLPGQPHEQRSQGIQSIGSQRVGYNWSDLACAFATHTHTRTHPDMYVYLFTHKHLLKYHIIATAHHLSPREVIIYLFIYFTQVYIECSLHARHSTRNRQWKHALSPLWAYNLWSIYPLSHQGLTLKHYITVHICSSL